MFLAKCEGFLNPQIGLVRKDDFCDTLISMKCKSSYFQINLFLTLAICYPLFREISAFFTRMEDSMKQFGLLPLETLAPRVQYGLLFQHLPSLSLR